MTDWLRETLLSEEAIVAAAAELDASDGEPYLGTAEARRGWARAVIEAALAAALRTDPKP